MSCNTRYWANEIMASKSNDKATTNPALQKENNDKLAALIAAREAQDAKWSFATTNVHNSNQNQHQNPK